MIHVVSGQTSTEAWLKAADLLWGCQDRIAYNIILDITDPVTVTAADFAVLDTVDLFLRRFPKAKPLTTVAGTIFPAGYYARHGVEGVYERYPAAYPKMEKGWGCYAMRMLRRKGKDGEDINPLKMLVEKMRRQLTGTRMRAIYDLGTMDDELYDIPIYAPATDACQTRGRQPCLSHLSFKIMPDDRLMLTVMYRYHYYVGKALGNLIGLGQLQQFVAEQVGLNVGPLVCHSTYATLDTEGGWKVADLEALIAACKAVRPVADAA